MGLSDEQLIRALKATYPKDPVLQELIKRFEKLKNATQDGEIQCLI